MLDREGYRPNVGIVLLNQRNEVFWGKRVGQHSWQFPQGGIQHGENPEQAMYRELHEEIGLEPQHVQIIGRTREWLRYDVPAEFLRRSTSPSNRRSNRQAYRGQKQIWFLLRMVGRDSDVCLRATDHPEFDAWRWSPYWIPVTSFGAMVGVIMPILTIASSLSPFLGAAPNKPINKVLNSIFRVKITMPRLRSI